MTKFVDENGKGANISITDNLTWIDFEQVFYNTGLLKYDDVASAYLVDDIQYLIDQANDAIKGVGDFESPMNAKLNVEWIK